LLHFLNDKGKNWIFVFVTFVLIFKFIFIYLLHVLFVLKTEGIFEMEKGSAMKGVVFLYIV